jgi:putative ABC transport system permease protein
MFVLRLVLKNALRHKLRTVLTILGIAIAVTSFGFIRTILTAWSAGVEASATNRMITRHAVSFIFPLPLAYRDKIAGVPGVETVSFANWFGGNYKDPADFNNFFPRFGVDAETYLDVYPEFILPEEDRRAFLSERNACIIGEKLARQQKLKRGDLMPLEGDIYPGRWEFVVRGIYRGKDPSVDETQMLFHWKYLDERITEIQPTRSGNVGWYVFRVADPSEMPRIARAIDELFFNSRASTKTETEKEFQQSFVSMSSAILSSLEAVSIIIVGIILLVLANTIVMSARERRREYAVLKTLGFRPYHISGLIGGESLLIAVLGGALGLALTYPLAQAFSSVFATLFPVFRVEVETVALASLVALAAGLAAALIPTVRTLRMRIAEGLRAIG